MKKPTHTPEPWHTFFYELYDENDQIIADCGYSEDVFTKEGCKANAKRIVECVNAMEGIENPAAYMQVTKQLELDAYMKLKPQYDELRQFLNDINTVWKRGESIKPDSVLAHVLDEYLNM